MKPRGTYTYSLNGVVMRFTKIAEYFGVCNTTIKNLKKNLEVGNSFIYKYESPKNNLTGIVKVERIF